MTWRTITTLVDRETGEALTNKDIEKGIYIKIKLNTKYEKRSEHYGIRRNTWECERNRQTKLEI